MIQDMKRNIQMRNMGFTASKQQTVVQPDLQSGCKEYKDLKSDRCIANADIQSKRIANRSNRSHGDVTEIYAHRSVECCGMQ